MQSARFVLTPVLRTHRLRLVVDEWEPSPKIILPDLPNESGGIVEFDVLGINLRGGRSRRRNAADKTAVVLSMGKDVDLAPIVIYLHQLTKFHAEGSTDGLRFLSGILCGAMTTSFLRGSS